MALVQRAGVGSGDTNIDHRRTETLRRFFARHAESLAVSEFPEDYKPGDIVTYYRPFSRVSRAHIAIVSAKDIVGPYEDAWQRIRARFGPGEMPRTVNFVSGPSRTGDIGGQLVMGAHGPRRMCVIIVDG